MENRETRERKPETRRKERERHQEQEQADNNDDEEEEKMEKFFALMRSTREIRDQMRRGSSTGGPEGKAENKVHEEDDKALAATPPWNPTFQREDFAKDHLAGPSNVQEKEGSNRKDDQEEADGSSGLDLRLSL